MDDFSRQLFGEHRSLEFTFSSENEVKRRKSEKSLFNRTLAPEDYVELVGAPDGATVNVTFDVDYDRIVIATSHEYYNHPQTRGLYWHQGKRTIDNVKFLTYEDAPEGLGTRVFARQVEMARSIGVEQLTTYASGKPGDEWVGFYVWPRLGYNMTIGDRRADLEAAGFFRVEDTNALFKLEGGPEWWKQNGNAGECVFDLDQFSPMSTLLRDYLATKGVAVV